MDTDVKNVSRVDEINPIVQPFLQGTRGRDLNNWGPRIGFNWAPGDGRTSVHGGYGIYYDRITLQIQSLERGLDGRALPVEVRAGNVFFLDSMTGQFPPFAPSIGQPVHRLHPPRARAHRASTSSTTTMQNPSVQQFNLGFQRELPWNIVLRVDGVHDLGTHFIIGRPSARCSTPWSAVPIASSTSSRASTPTTTRCFSARSDAVSASVSARTYTFFQVV